MLVGTRKGAWVLSADAARASWVVCGPMFLGNIAQHVVLDPRDRMTMLLATRTGHLGPTVYRSTDLGRSWTEAGRPPAFAAGDPLAADPERGVLADAGPCERTGFVVRGRITAGIVPIRRRRRHVGAGERLERPQALGDMGRVAR